MSDKPHKEPLTSRQEQILRGAEFHSLYTIQEIAALLSSPPSPATLRRDMNALIGAGFFLQHGERKSTKYELALHGQLFAPIDAHEYCGLEVDSRPGNTSYNFELFPSISLSLLSEEERTELSQGTELFVQSGEGASQTICTKELERFVIELSWKSSKIEGNTYTLLDTEILLKDGVEAEGRSREEAVMILNHKRAFDFILERRTDFAEPTLCKVQDLHRLLVEELNISTGLRSRLIGITGSVYRPLQVPTQIEEACGELFHAVKRLRDPYSQALLLLAGLSYIQPFEDGNKRTARLTANALLLAANCAPLSYRSISEVEYREAVLAFYERNSILPLKKLFLQQYLFACENYLKFV
jgi:Fic family protein